MAVAIASSSNGAFTTGNLVLTKPSGLAVGDLMVVAIVQINANGVTTPSGWTNEFNRASNGGGVQLRVYSKVADSSDVAATNFTFADSGSSYRKSGCILRITGNNVAVPLAVFASDGTVTSTASPSFGNSVTPLTANSILLFMTGTYISTANAHSFSAYAIATSNPSWTEIYDDSNAVGGNTNGIAIAYASRPQITATGNSSLTISATATELVSVMLVVRPQVVTTQSETLSISEVFKKGVTKNILDTITTTDTLEDEKKEWSNLDKNSSSWNNIDKN